MHILVQENEGGSYLDSSGGWKPSRDQARIFPSMLAAMDFCIRRHLWNTNLVVQLDPPGGNVIISLARSVESTLRPETKLCDR